MNKKVLMITATLVIGAAVVLLFDGAKDRQVDPKVGKPMVQSSELLNLTEIEISRGDTTLKLVLAEDKVWHLNELSGFPADASKVSRALDDLSKTQIQVVAAASSSKEAMSEFGFDNATRVKLSAAAGKELFTAHFANNREKGGQYVSIGDDFKVYLIGQAVQFMPDVAEWELKSLLNVTQEQVKSIEFVPSAALKKKPVLLARTKVEDPIAVDKVPNGLKDAASIRTHESILSNITFTGRVDPSNEQFKAAMATPSSVSVTLFDGRTYVAKVGSTGDGNGKKYYLQLTGVKGEATAEAEVKNLESLNDLMTRFAFEVSSFIGGKFEKGQEDMVEKKDS